MIVTLVRSKDVAKEIWHKALLYKGFPQIGDYCTFMFLASNGNGSPAWTPWSRAKEAGSPDLAAVPIAKADWAVATDEQSSAPLDG